MVILKSVLFLAFLFLAVYGFLKLIPIMINDLKTAIFWLVGKYVAHLEKRENRRTKTSGGDYFDDDDTEQIELDEKFYQDVVDEYDPDRYDDFDDYE